MCPIVRELMVPPNMALIAEGKEPDFGRTGRPRTVAEAREAYYRCPDGSDQQLAVAYVWRALFREASENCVIPEEYAEIAPEIPNDAAIRREFMAGWAISTSVSFRFVSKTGFPELFKLLGLSAPETAQEREVLDAAIEAARDENDLHGLFYSAAARHHIGSKRRLEDRWCVMAEERIRGMTCFTALTAEYENGAPIGFVKYIAAMRMAELVDPRTEKPDTDKETALKVAKERFSAIRSRAGCISEPTIAAFLKLREAEAR